MVAFLFFLLASAPRTSENPESLIQDKLLAPLAAREGARSRYSRAASPAAERRLRLLDTEPVMDAKGSAFVRFAVDARYGLAVELRRDGGGRWQQNAITGCVYPGSGEVYLRYGDAFRSAGVLLGRKTLRAASHVCRAARPSARATNP
jgi:hypothetical protein